MRTEHGKFDDKNIFLFWMGGCSAFHGLLRNGGKRQVGKNYRLHQLELVRLQGGSQVGSGQGQDGQGGGQSAGQSLFYYPASLQGGNAAASQRNQLQPGQRHRARNQWIEEVGQLVAVKGEQLEAQLLGPREHEGGGWLHC